MLSFQKLLGNFLHKSLYNTGRMTSREFFLYIFKFITFVHYLLERFNNKNRCTIFTTGHLSLETF